MKKTIPVLAFLGIAAASFAAYRKHKEGQKKKSISQTEDRPHFSDDSELKIPQEVDDNAKQSYRIQARLMAEFYAESDVLDLIHTVSFPNADRLFAFVKDAKKSHYHLDEARPDNSITVRLQMPATVDAIYSSIMEVIEMAFINHGSYKGFTRSKTDIE